MEDRARDDVTGQFENAASRHFEGLLTFPIRPLKRFLAAEEQ